MTVFMGHVLFGEVFSQHTWQHNWSWHLKCYRHV